jgi:hypothetical protein
MIDIDQTVENDWLYPKSGHRDESDEKEENTIFG